MSNKLPPLPPGTPVNSAWFADFVEKVRFLVNDLLTSISWTLITGKPTTLAGYGITDPVELTTHKDAVSGYAGLNGVSRTTKGVDTTDDLITDSTAKGPVMKSPNGHYWRATISNVGVVTWTDLGTTKP